MMHKISFRCRVAKLNIMVKTGRKLHTTWLFKEYPLYKASNLNFISLMVFPHINLTRANHMK